MYTHWHVARDFAFLAAAWGMEIWALIEWYDSESYNGGASGRW